MSEGPDSLRYIPENYAERIIMRWVRRLEFLASQPSTAAHITQITLHDEFGMSEECLLRHLATLTHMNTVDFRLLRRRVSVETAINILRALPSVHELHWHMSSWSADDFEAMLSSGCSSLTSLTITKRRGHPNSQLMPAILAFDSPRGQLRELVVHIREDHGLSFGPLVQAVRSFPSLQTLRIMVINPQYTEMLQTGEHRRLRPCV